ncbi:MAG: amidohydrolase family protein, partial [Candidatus Halalkalibacterium sp. M3_1C_030]
MLLFFASILFLFLNACTTSDSDKKTSVQVLKGATIFDGTGSDAIKNSVIVISENKIECVGSEDDCETPADAELIDVSGKYITPGLIDGHVHFF